MVEQRTLRDLLFQPDAQRTALFASQRELARVLFKGGAYRNEEVAAVAVNQMVSGKRHLTAQAAAAVLKKARDEKWSAKLVRQLETALRTPPDGVLSKAVKEIYDRQKEASEVVIASPYTLAGRSYDRSEDFDALMVEGTEAGHRYTFVLDAKDQPWVKFWRRTHRSFARVLKLDDDRAGDRIRALEGGGRLRIVAFDGAMLIIPLVALDPDEDTRRIYVWDAESQADDEAEDRIALLSRRTTERWFDQIYLPRIAPPRSAVPNSYDAAVRAMGEHDG